MAAKLIDQQEITTDVAFPVVGPIAFEWVIEPFGPKTWPHLPLCQRGRLGAAQTAGITKLRLPR